jgi:hypothetical protein
MFKRLCWAGVLWLLGGSLGCASPNPNVRVRRLPDKRLEVDGPLAGPFKTLEDLAQNACELITSQPGAANGANGFEYCALYYHSSSDGGFFLSYLSNVGRNMAGGKKSCEVPRALHDPAHPDAVLLGGGHNHTENREFSRRDTSIWAHWLPTRFVDPSTKQIWDRRLMVFFREKTGACSVYLYNNATRVVSALRAGEWVPIGQAYNDVGDVRMFEGKDWVP